MSSPSSVNARIIAADPSLHSDGIWETMEPVIRAGETYPYPPDWSRDEALAYWFGKKNSYVCLVDAESESEGEMHGVVAGTLYITPNQACLGAHICNAGIMVHSDHWRKGLGTKMGEFIVEEAPRLGYVAIQYNLVVESNVASMRIWKKLGFAVKCRLEKSFRHAKLGLVDSFIMYKWVGTEELQIEGAEEDAVSVVVED